MGWDGVPWMVGGGAQHSAEVARMLAFVAFRGNEGVVGPDDLKVKALAVPGAGVTVDPGACSILCRAAGQLHQAYAGRCATQDTAGIAATGAGAGRSDLVIARVEDPWLAGEPWSDPADPAVGPYINTVVIPGVPPTTRRLTDLGLGFSGIALARVDIPPSTATVTQAMIADLRRIANPRRERDLVVKFPGGDNNISGTAYGVWPAASQISVEVPAWATHVRVNITLQGIEHIPGASTPTVAGLKTVYNGSDYSSENGILVETVAGRGYYSVAGEHAIPAAHRGTTRTLAAAGVRSGGSGTFQADYQSIITIDYEFVEKPA
ncbi:hypothetical protein [Micromonospora aurantiaca (nom. illeg.)]|uniref:hypothetical protein n=1 Tax=Micromonospora aurantiaca (nom. illeg.) TaxID=47850 RepID=UPI0011A6AD55|nr:hypothetical protein [Micromonospora aurantiaca]MBC9000510.1 hypothetical protein [Micromonospora aurantiaca]